MARDNDSLDSMLAFIDSSEAPYAQNGAVDVRRSVGTKVGKNRDTLEDLVQDLGDTSSLHGSNLLRSSDLRVSDLRVSDLHASDLRGSLRESIDGDMLVDIEQFDMVDLSDLMCGAEQEAAAAEELGELVDSVTGKNGMDFEETSYITPDSTPLRDDDMPSLQPSVEPAISMPDQVTSEIPTINAKYNGEFQSQYYRNDRKNLQCFPLCPEFGTFYNSKVEGAKV
jgi:hypothetical protein